MRGRVLPDIMSDGTNILKNLKPAREFFIGIDSDGCVFDTMEIKHKECFIPVFIKHFHLQAASKFARETWEFVNLYSKTRGMNRFPALSRTLNLLRNRPEVNARRVVIPDTTSLDAWIARENKLTNATLKTAAAGDAFLQQVLEWSVDVNKAIATLVHGVPPFPWFRESLEKMIKHADVVVVSQTPTEALVREWAEHNIADCVRAIAGQELGTKAEHIALAAGGKYRAGRILMIGDAPGDYKAARANNALFYPINPGHEEASWELFFKEALDRFFSGSYSGDYEAELLRRFEQCLPEQPPWASRS